MSFDIKEFQNKKVHMIGIGGSMMSGIAGILINNGIKVSGSDFKESIQLDNVRKMGASIKSEHHGDNVYDQDLIIYTAGAIKEDNPELVKARELNIPILKRSEFLGHLMNNFDNSVGISGTHGKTSTSSMLTSICLEANLDPTVLVGSHVPSINSNYRVGNSEVMVVESCEYQKSFLDFPPKIAIVLNVEEDHVDCYKDLDEVNKAFVQYMDSVRPGGFVVVNADDKNLMEIVKDVDKTVVTFGIESGAFRAKNLTINEEGRYNFDFYEGERYIFNIQMPVPGKFNVYNALAALVAATILGADNDKIASGLQKYSGVNRRLQDLGVIDGVRYIDDYGHHPTEVKNAVDTVLGFKHRKLIAIEQPHTYSRLNRFFDDFAKCFDDVDNLVILPVFAAREIDTGVTSSKKLGEAITKRNTVNTTVVDSYEEAAQFCKDHAKEGDIVLLIGAGQGYKVFDILKEDFNLRNNIK